MPAPEHSPTRVPGYQKTEVGVVPEDWETPTIYGVSHRIMDYRGRTPKKLGMEWGQGDIPALSAGNVKMGFIDFSRECYYGSDALYERWMTQGDVKKDDIIFTTEAPLGNVALIPDGRKYILSQRTILLQADPAQVSSRFVFQYMLSAQFQRILADYSSGSTAKGIQRKKFEQLRIPKPPLPEQQAIAAALGDVDGLLNGLDRLIAKKRDLKQAAMQQLLTGHTRLPGFQGEWNLKRLRDVFTISAGKSKSAHVVEDGDFWVCDMGSVSTEGRLIVSKRTNYGGDFLRRGDLVMPKDDIGGGNIIGKVGYIDANDTYVLGDHVYCLRALEGDPRFLAYMINSYCVNTELRKKVIGSAQLGLGRISVNAQEILFPSVPEQTAIAEVLSNMDDEIAALKQRRDKTRALKQAMMQELLTGRTRLV